MEEKQAIEYNCLLEESVPVLQVAQMITAHVAERHDPLNDPELNPFIHGRRNSKRCFC